MILVLGDIIVDEYVRGNVTTQAREAKIPVLKKESIELRLGGAANVAANIKSLGGDPVLFGTVVNDAYGVFVLDRLKKLGINFAGIILDKDKSKLSTVQTVVKTRFCENDKYLFRVDSSTKVIPENLTKKDLDFCTTKFENILKTASALVVSDYGYNTIDFISVQTINEIYSKYYIPVFVDSRTRIDEFKNVHTLLPGVDDVGPKTIENCKKMLLESGSDYLLFKLGKDGLVLFTQEKQIYRAFENDVEVIDTCGAGDSVLAAWTITCGSTKPIENKLDFANKAGVEKIKHWGTYPVRVEN